MGNVSDEGDTSLVSFGEGASTLSGPSSHPALSRMSSGGRQSSLGSPTMNRSNPLAAYLQHNNENQTMPSPLSPAGSNTPERTEDARMVDGMTYDPDIVDTTTRTPRLATPYSGGGSSG